MQKILYSLLVFVLGMAAAAAIFLIAKPPAGSEIILHPPAEPLPLVVQVDGAVQQPGVYSLPTGSRVQDALDAAGGPSDEADLSKTNLAAKLRDGEKVTILRLDETPPVAAQTRQPEGSVEQQPNPAEPLATPGPVNINTATAEELDTLPGIGPSKAADIIAYREAHNGFTSIDEIQNVTGIGPATFERLKEWITIE